jgi:hypothetical protein
MRKRDWATALLAVTVAAGAWAQEQDPEQAPAQDEAQPDEDEARPEPTHRIKVLQHPYDLASFYRARPSGSYGFFAGELDGGPWAERYPIAGYYRAGGPIGGRYGYSRFWTRGYGRGRVTGLPFRYRRTIGQNGDLYLFAPTVLATVGPLTGVFYDGR